jgi:hypothetical protein
LAGDHQPAWPNREAAAAARLFDTVAYTKDPDVAESPASTLFSPPHESAR